MENKDSGCYYGEFPLSFAASVGNVEVCNLLYYCWQRRISEASQKNQEGKPTLKMTHAEKAACRSKQIKVFEQMFQTNSFAKLNPHKYPLDSTLEEEKDNLKDAKMWYFINAADSLGNTAMHMAVYHKRKDIIDWLMTKQEGKHSLDLLNHDGYTPLTWAARYGHVDIFHHILYNHMSIVAWTYGKVVIVKHSLSDI
jgi:hypothetical protein